MGKYQDYQDRLNDVVANGNMTMYTNKNQKRVYLLCKAGAINSVKSVNLSLTDVFKKKKRLTGSYNLYVYDLYGAWRDHKLDHVTIQKGRMYFRKEGYAHVTSVFNFVNPTLDTIEKFIVDKYGSYLYHAKGRTYIKQCLFDGEGLFSTNMIFKWDKTNKALGWRDNKIKKIVVKNNKKAKAQAEARAKKEVDI